MKYNLKESPLWLQKNGNMENAKEATAFSRLSKKEAMGGNKKESKKTLKKQSMSGIRHLLDPTGID